MAVWPLFFLVALAPELLGTLEVTSRETTRTLSVAPELATTLAPSSPAHAWPGGSTTRPVAKSTPSNRATSTTEATSAKGATSGPTPASTPTETPPTERLTGTPGKVATGPETSTVLETSSEPLASTGKEPASHATATALPTSGDDESSLSQKPGLVAVICIFLCILLIGTGVILVKCCRARKPSFKKLNEVPMGKVDEDSPFARYPPK